MSGKQKQRKLRRFFTSQTLGATAGDLWLDSAEGHHLRDSLRLAPGDACLVTDGRGGEVEAVVAAFASDGRVHLRILKVLVRTGSFEDVVTLRVFPAMLRQGKTDLLVEKAQELGVHGFCPVVSEHCEVHVASEKTEKIVERWNRIAREASKQSGNLKLLRIESPRRFKEAVERLPAEELLVIFHPGADAVPFPHWIEEFRGRKQKACVLNLFIGPEGGFSEEEIRWARWHRREKNIRLVGLGSVLFRADTAFIGIIASLRFSGALET